MTADRDQLRQQLAEESARHHLMIGVDQRVVMCVCGWSSTDEANLRRPHAPFGDHVADALLPVVEAHTRELAAAELVRMAELLERNHNRGPARRCRIRAEALRTHEGDTHA